MNCYFTDFPIKIEKHINYVNNIFDKAITKEGHYFTINNEIFENGVKNKQGNLYYLSSLLPDNANICEIGFNAGHSSILILSALNTKKINFTIFDLGHHNYSILCLDYIKSIYTTANINYIEGNSIETIPEFIKNNKTPILYDLIHIDGGHTEECIINDMKNANILIKKGGIIVIDDTHLRYIYNIIDSYINSNEYDEIKLLELDHDTPHRIIKKK
jgi:predicted O-methyltransferase YrrM